MLSALTLGAVLLASCSAPLSVRAARSGDEATLRNALARDRAEGKLDRGRVLDIAHEVGEREIREAPADSSARIEEAETCARALSRALETRARRADEGGAAAKLALLDAGADRDQSEDLLVRYGSSQNPLWRAVAARAATGHALGPARRKFYGDADERVRLAALRAALAEADRADASKLVEVARVDPNPLAQSLATRALGPIANAETVLALRDRYASADDGLRQSIVDAWGNPEAASVGGLREIIHVAETERGAPAVEAGAVLLRFRGEQDAAAIGTRALLRAMSDGLTRDRVLAIRNAPVADPQVADELRKASRVEDPSIKAAALLRLAENPATRRQALEDLWAMQREGQRIAIFALARAGAREVAGLLEQDLASKESSTRLSAMRGLIALGQVVRVADLLADDDPHVRMTTSCAILATPPAPDGSAI